MNKKSTRKGLNAFKTVLLELIKDQLNHNTKKDVRSQSVLEQKIEHIFQQTLEKRECTCFEYTHFPLPLDEKRWTQVWDALGKALAEDPKTIVDYLLQQGKESAHMTSLWDGMLWLYANNPQELGFFNLLAKILTISDDVQKQKIYNSRALVRELVIVMQQQNNLEVNTFLWSLLSTGIDASISSSRAWHNSQWSESQSFIHLLDLFIQSSVNTQKEMMPSIKKLIESFDFKSLMSSPHFTKSIWCQTISRFNESVTPLYKELVYYVHCRVLKAIEMNKEQLAVFLTEYDLYAFLTHYYNSSSTFMQERERHGLWNSIFSTLLNKSFAHISIDFFFSVRRDGLALSGSNHVMGVIDREMKTLQKARYAATVLHEKKQTELDGYKEGTFFFQLLKVVNTLKIKDCEQELQLQKNIVKLILKCRPKKNEDFLQWENIWLGDGEGFRMRRLVEIVYESHFNPTTMNIYNLICDRLSEEALHTFWTTAPSQDAARVAPLSLLLTDLYKEERSIDQSSPASIIAIDNRIRFIEGIIGAQKVFSLTYWKSCLRMDVEGERRNIDIFTLLYQSFKKRKAPMYVSLFDQIFSKIDTDVCSVLLSQLKDNSQSVLRSFLTLAYSMHGGARLQSALVNCVIKLEKTGGIQLDQFWLAAESSMDSFSQYAPLSCWVKLMTLETNEVSRLFEKLKTLSIHFHGLTDFIWKEGKNNNMLHLTQFMQSNLGHKDIMDFIAFYLKVCHHVFSPKNRGSLSKPLIDQIRHLYRAVEAHPDRSSNQYIKRLYNQLDKHIGETLSSGNHSLFAVGVSLRNNMVSPIAHTKRPNLLKITDWKRGV